MNWAIDVRNANASRDALVREPFELIKEGMRTVK